MTVTTPAAAQREVASAGRTTTVSTKNAATSAPRLMQLRAGQHQRADLIRADSLRYATIEPVKVTAPMKTPTITSTSWIVG